MTQMVWLISYSQSSGLGSITMNKASGGDGIPVKLFKILRDDEAKINATLNMPSNFEVSGHRTGKGQFSFQSQRSAMLENVHATAQLQSSHMLAK